LKLGAPKEIGEGELRVALTPESAKKLKKLGFRCAIESGAGQAAGFPDSRYSDLGVEVCGSSKELWQTSDLVLKVLPPTLAELDLLTSSHILISFFWPGQNTDLLEKACKTGATILAMDMVPRISRAQKLDALSSMANISGYRAVLEAGNNFGRFFAGQVTAAGKVPPAKVLVIGAGVAGLSAIGTAVSLGALVRAFDVRPEVAEQIQSMGAEFLFLDFDEDGSGSGGYAKPSSPEFRKKQLELFRNQAPELDIVITTALIPGADAPKLWLKDMVEAMKPGSVVVDLAAERGGNCEVTVPNSRVVTENGVAVIGYTDFPSRMSSQSSSLYATNILNLVAELTPEKNGSPVLDLDDDVLRGVTVAHAGQIMFPPPAPKVPAIKHPPLVPDRKPTREELLAAEAARFRRSTKIQISMLVAGAAFMLLAGYFTPPSFMQHFVVFLLSCFIGFQVIWNVSHSLHTPLMSVTNAISGIIVVGALLQIGSNAPIVYVLSAISILIATINIVGGFLVTRRMLAMFQKS